MRRSKFVRMERNTAHARPSLVFVFELPGGGMRHVSPPGQYLKWHGYEKVLEMCWGRVERELDGEGAGDVPRAG
jgi:hypothetical protein